MRIAYLCADFGIPIRGHKGASVHVREMVAALAAHGHEVRVFSPNPGQGNDLAAQLREIGADGLPNTCGRLARTVTRGRYPRLDKEVRELAYNLTLYRGVRTESRCWRPEAIYERYSLMSLVGLALARRIGVPHLLEVNAPLRLERARTKGLVLDGAAGAVERWLFDASDAVLVVSEALRRYVLEHGGHTASTVVMPNGVDTRRFRPEEGATAMRARLGLADDAFVVGFAGSLKPWHGVETLLEAFAALHLDVSAARLVIVGDGPQGDALRGQAARLGIDEQSIFTGKVAHQEMPALLAAMDVGVAPYARVPDFYFSPLKIYEYMAVGLAVVGSDAGEIAALVRDGQTGLMCPPEDAQALAGALRRLARDPGLRVQLGAAARAEAERYTWENNARSVASLIDELRTGRHGATGRRSAPAGIGALVKGPGMRDGR
jgi:glycosyltransferase involved in cell wall biosynthesis